MSNLAVVGIGPTEIIIVLILVLLIFGAKRLPEVGRSLGTGMREFKDSVTGKGGDDDEPEQLDRPAKVDATADEERREPSATRAGAAGDTSP